MLQRCSVVINDLSRLFLPNIRIGAQTGVSETGAVSELAPHTVGLQRFGRRLVTGTVGTLGTRRAHGTSHCSGPGTQTARHKRAARNQTCDRTKSEIAKAKLSAGKKAVRPSGPVEGPAHRQVPRRCLRQSVSGTAARQAVVRLASQTVATGQLCRAQPQHNAAHRSGNDAEVDCFFRDLGRRLLHLDRKACSARRSSRPDPDGRPRRMQQCMAQHGTACCVSCAAWWVWPAHARWRGVCCRLDRSLLPFCSMPTLCMFACSTLRCFIAGSMARNAPRFEQKRLMKSDVEITLTDGSSSCKAQRPHRIDRHNS